MEVNVGGGSQTHVVGLPDNAVKESILRVSTAFANNADDDKKKKDNQQLRTEIVNLLGSGETTLNISCKAMVSFMINNEGEIVVISVDSKNNALESYVKRKLNF